MHEFSLCQGIIKQVLAANENSLTDVSEIILEVGELANVDIPSLSFWFPVVAKKAEYPNVRLTVNKIAGFAKCGNCQHEFHINKLYSACPACKEFGDYSLIRGNELLVKSYRKK